MKLFKAIYGLLLIALAGTAIFSCDKVEEPFTKELDINDSLTKTVLLEDYTGHKCVNCPEAAILASNLKKNLGENLVVIAVHAGHFATPTISGDFTADYTTPEGEEWNTTFGIQSNPSGMVNRKGFSEAKHILSVGAWSDAILSALREPATLDLEVTNDYNNSSRVLSTSIETKFLTNLDKNLKLVVVITESGIVSPQKSNDPEEPIIMNYVHNHMLRASVNGTWGTALAITGTPNPSSVIKTFNYTLPETFVPENCHVVAFVYDTDTKEVLEAAESSVVTPD